jgi:putative membrane protein
MNSKLTGYVMGLMLTMPVAAASWAADNATFLQEAIKGSLAEVQMGQLAQQNGQSDEVKSFGAQLVADHSSALDKAKTLASSAGTPVPEQPTPEAQAQYEKLQILTGADFDEEFSKHMVMDHEKDIAKFEEQAGGNDEVAAFAKETLPTLKTHLDVATALSKQQK